MDLLQFDMSSDAGAWMTVIHPGTGKPLTYKVTDDEGFDVDKPVRINFVSPDHPRVRQRQHQQLRETFEKGENSTAEEIEINGTKLLAAATVGWEGVGIDEESTEFSEENAFKLFSRLYWLRIAADRFLTNRKNFLPASLIS